MFQRISGDRAERFARSRQLRVDRMSGYSDFGCALAESRRGQFTYGKRRREAYESAARLEARDEAHRLRGAASQALFRVRLLASYQEMVDLAQRAYKLTNEIHHAASAEEAVRLADLARECADEFLALASAHVRGDAPGVGDD